jgi:hypothetical protein
LIEYTGHARLGVAVAASPTLRDVIDVLAERVRDALGI